MYCEISPIEFMLKGKRTIRLYDSFIMSKRVSIGISYHIHVYVNISFFSQKYKLAHPYKKSSKKFSI